MAISFQQMTTHPAYVNANFEVQSKTRQDWVNKVLIRNPQFLQLDQEAKKNTIAAAIFAPPSFINKELGAQVNDLSQKVQQGDQESRKEMETLVLTQVRRSHSVIARIAGDFAGVLLKGLGIKDTSTLATMPEELQNQPELNKAVSYFSSVLDQTEEDKDGFNSLKILNVFASSLGDFAAISGMVGTGVQSAKGVGLLAKFAEKAVTKGATTSGRLLLGRLTGEAAHAVVTSTLGVGREFALEALNDQGKENQDFQTILQKSSRWFGAYFIGDLAVNWATSVVAPMVKLGLKGGIPGYGDVSSMYKTLNSQDWKNIVQRTFAGEDIPKDLLARLPKELQRETLSTSATFKVLKNVESLTPEGALQVIANSKGFNLIQKANGFEISLKGTDKVKFVKNVKSANDYMIDVISKDQMNPIFKNVDLKEFAYRSAAAPHVEVSALIKGELKEGASGNINILTRLAAPVGGKFQKGKLQTFVKTFAKGNGAGDDVIKGLRVVDKGEVFEVFSKEGKLLDIPKGALSPGEEILRLKELTKRLAELTPEGKGLSTGGDFIKKYSKSLVDQNIFTAEWMSYVVDLDNGNLLKRGSKWVIQSKTDPNVLSTFDSLTDVGEHLIRKNINIDMLKQSADMQGYRFVGTEKSEIFKLKKGNVTIATGKTLNEIVDQVPEVLPKISSEMGPKLTLINETGTLGVRFTKDATVVSNQQNMLKFLDKFRKRSFGGSTFSLTGGSKGRIEFSSKRKQFEVLIPDIGERTIFDKIGEARKYLEGGWAEMDNMTFSALKKGYRLDYKVGKWFLYTDAGEKLMFNSFEEVTEGLKKVPMPEWAPELTGVPEELMENFKKPAQDFFRVKEPDLSNSPLDYTVQARAGVLWTPPKSTLEKFVSEGGDPSVLKMFNDIEAARTFVVGREGEFRKVILTLFDDGSGKVMKKKTRKWVGQYAEALNVKEQDQVIKDALRDKVTIGRREIEAADKLRDFYGRNPGEGAFAYFGVDQEKFIKNYLPHVKEYYEKNPRAAFTDGTQHAFLSQVFDNKVPREMDAFFKHSRTSDILDVALEKDPMAQLFRYTNVGLKEKYLGKLIENAKSLPAFKNDPAMKKRMYNYLAQIGGLPQGNAQEIIRSITPKILNKLGVSPTLTNDITSWFMSLGYSASMGFRPWLPIRNMNQIWTTLAMRMQGNNWVKDALKDVAGKNGGEVFDTLRKKGVIMSALPLFGSETFDQTELLGKITHKSLKMYKNSDDFTRAVAYQAASLKFDDAFGRIKGIGLDPNKFAHMSGISQMDPVGMRQVMGMMNEGNIRGARDIYATSIVTETMFPYRSGMAPLAFSGTIGKMFGMMGHYSAYYVDNIRRSLKYMTPGEKVLAGSIMVGNSAALYGAFRAIGVKADNFKPWEPALFTGGPSWEIMQDLLDATGTGPEGRQARAGLLGLSSKDGKVSFNPVNSTILKWTVPGAFEIKKMTDAVRLTNEGDSWGAFLTSMGSPYNSDWEVMN